MQPKSYQARHRNQATSNNPHTPTSQNPRASEKPTASTTHPHLKTKHTTKIETVPKTTTEKTPQQNTQKHHTTPTGNTTKLKFLPTPPNTHNTQSHSTSTPRPLLPKLIVASPALHDSNEKTSHQLRVLTPERNNTQANTVVALHHRRGPENTTQKRRCQEPAGFAPTRPHVTRPSKPASPRRIPTPRTNTVRDPPVALLPPIDRVRTRPPTSQPAVGFGPPISASRGMHPSPREEGHFSRLIFRPQPDHSPSASAGP